MQILNVTILTRFGEHRRVRTGPKYYINDDFSSCKPLVGSSILTLATILSQRCVADFQNVGWVISQRPPNLAKQVFLVLHLFSASAISSHQETFLM
jgi:hypothetical protein